MKITTQIFRILIACIFIISGLIKLNDPLGFSYKLEEYFSSQVFNLPFFEPYSLVISVIIAVLEVLLGVLLFLGFKANICLKWILGVLVFFSFLTFYSAYYDKVTDCGCFGDALKLNPWQSFNKDIILLVLVIWLVIYKKYIRVIMPPRRCLIFVLVIFLMCLWLPYYVLGHLPLVDFRPYKIGTDIKKSMRIPPNAPKPIFEYSWIFNNGDKDVIIKNHGDYPDTESDFISVSTRMISQGYIPPINKDFIIYLNNKDITEYILNEPKIIFVLAYNIDKSDPKGLDLISKSYKIWQEKGYKVMGLSSSSDTNRIKKQYKLDITFCSADSKIIKTIARANPAILKLHSGVIIQKLPYSSLKDLIIK